MRTKEKGRRRVNVGEQLETEELCSTSTHMQFSQTVTPLKRQRDMNEGGVRLPSVGGKVQKCQSVAGVEGGQVFGHVLCDQYLQNTFAGNRKPSQNNQLSQPDLEKMRIPSSTPVCSNRCRPYQRNRDGYSQPCDGNAFGNLCMRLNLQSLLLLYLSLSFLNSF